MSLSAPVLISASLVGTDANGAPIVRIAWSPYVAPEGYRDTVLVSNVQNSAGTNIIALIAAQRDSLVSPATFDITCPINGGVLTFNLNGWSNFSPVGASIDEYNRSMEMIPQSDSLQVDVGHAHGHGHGHR